MSEAQSRIVKPEFEMWLRPDGIVHLVWARGVAMTLKDAQAAIQALTDITGGRAVPLMVDVRHAGAQDRACRQEFIRRSDMVLAVALIVDSPLSRMMGQFFVNVSRPVAVTRLFDDEAAAVAWLRQAMK